MTYGRDFFNIRRMEIREPLVPVPDFERRCDAFVEEVLSTVVPRYKPDLDIMAVNETNASLSMPAAIEELARKAAPRPESEEWREYLEEAREISRAAEIQSATANRAAVIIIPMRDSLEEKARQATAEIKEIAARHQADQVEESEVSVTGYLSPSILLDVWFKRKKDQWG